MLTTMNTRSAEPSRASSSPGEFVVRDAVADDASAIEAVHYASREAAYKDRTADWPPRGPDRSGRVARWMRWLADPEITCVVATEGKELAGFCTICPSRDEDADPAHVAEMPTLYVRPSSWSQGVGRMLCEVVVNRARRAGFTELTLWVLDINSRACAFYEEFGFEPDGASKIDEETTENLVAKRYRMHLDG